MRTHPAPTLRTYSDGLSRFRDFLRQQGHELLSNPAIITHFTPLWATTPLSRKERLAPLSHAAAHKRLAILSSFYRFVVQGRFDARFTASLIPIHTAATSNWQAHPHQRGFDPQRATDALQQLSCSTPESCRDYALLWIGLTSARSSRDLLSLTVGDLHFDASANACSLAWPEPNPRLQLHWAHLSLPTHAATALLAYLCEVYHAPLASLDAALPLWVSFPTRNAGRAISAQTLADIARKH